MTVIFKGNASMQKTGTAEADIKPKARDSIHTVILDWFSSMPKGRLLDAPAGFGHLSMRLHEMGFEVVCGEIEPEIFKVNGLTCVYTDLNRKMDAPDASFDYICCVDGLEHMTDPYTAVREFARVLKPGGYGVFSIPNYSGIESRAKFFYHGFLEKPKSLEYYRQDGSNLFNFHNSPLTITLLDVMFMVNDLSIHEIRRDSVKWKQYCFLPIVGFLKLIACLSSRKTQEKYRYDLTLKNEVVLGGNTLIIITQKNR